MAAPIRPEDTIKSRNVNVKGDFGNLISTLLNQYANPSVPQVRGGWTPAQANQRMQSRQIKARREALNALSGALRGNIAGETSRDVQEMRGETATNVEEMRGTTARDVQAARNLGALAQLDRRGELAQEERQWKSGENLLSSNRQLVSNILQKGGTMSRGLEDIYNATPESTVDFRNLMGQRLIPQAPQKPLGYSVGERLLMDEEGNPVYKGNKPVYEKYLYNKETGMPMGTNPQPQTQQAPQVTPSQAMQQARQWLNENQTQKPQKKYDLNKYYR